jgi:predicted dinucleotide-binding enzyme
MSTIAVIPGTGNMGFGLSRLFASAGHRILLGSRDAAKAEEASKKIIAEFPNASIQHGENHTLPIATVTIFL